jgi:ArsR family transcriptional regulator
MLESYLGQSSMLRGNVNTSNKAADSSPKVAEVDPVRAIKAVGDRTRLQILKVLLQGEQCVTDIAHLLGLAQPRISHHLTILRNSGLVLDRRNGKQIIYSVNPDHRAAGDGSYTLQVDCLRVEFTDE